MIVTEEEAKTKWCPEVRTGLIAGMAVNHHIGSRHDSPHAGDVHEETRCIGSGCMMWRKIDQIGIGPNGEKRERDMDGRTRWVDRGYCGKAGKP